MLLDIRVVEGNRAAVAESARSLEQAKVELLSQPELVAQGALIGYGVNFYDVGQLSAKYVQRVLTGTSPENLPVESFSRLELGINFKTARELGITIPQSVVFRADKVVE